jgi:predicted amidophosphoribosyltransferase
MHWKKNRKVHPEMKDQIIQHGECPGCGTPVKFYYGEAGQFCPECRKMVEADLREERIERLANRESAKKRSR